MATLSGGQVDGTDEGDLINGYGADFLLRGRGGDDTIYGPFGTNNGTIAGDEGDDLIVIRRAGELSIEGGDGDDIVEIQEGSPYAELDLDGGEGHDVLILRGYNYLHDQSIEGFERFEIEGIVWITESQIFDASGAAVVEIGFTDWSRSRGQLTIGIEGGRLDASTLVAMGLPAGALGPIALMGSVDDDKII